LFYFFLNISKYNSSSFFPLNYKNQISILEKEVDDRICELNKIKVDLKQNEMVVSEQALTIQAILDERDSLSMKVENLTKEKVRLKLSLFLIKLILFN